ncbi:ATP-binding protein [Candidatus Gottesmanbacteria bacterium]|nr:ATP-binding protein [Candidatus Gottesmanbacteria bacterium]
MIPRLVEKMVYTLLDQPRKIVLIVGARQVGKTTLLKHLQANLEQKRKRVIYLNCDIAEDLSRVNTFSLTLLQQLTSNVDFLLLDEAQRLGDPGRTLKILHDHIPAVRVIATGSSSLDLKNTLSDPLTGRLRDLMLSPLSLGELMGDIGGPQQAPYLADGLMTYGGYPEIALTNDPVQKQVQLTKIIDAYLFKDILAFQKVRQPQILIDLVRALAYQIGAEVNENELASRLKIDRKTVVNYIDLLVKTFVLVRVFPFSKNPRREIGKNFKVYFVDLGIRNALIGDFHAVHLRADVGALWENFLVIERLKMFTNTGKPVQYHFWRTYGGAEVDYLERETTRTTIRAFEFKWGSGRLSRGARSFTHTYNIPVTLVNRENFLTFTNHALT